MSEPIDLNKYKGHSPVPWVETSFGVFVNDRFVGSEPDNRIIADIRGNFADSALIADAPRILALLIETIELFEETIIEHGLDEQLIESILRQIVWGKRPPRKPRDPRNITTGPYDPVEDNKEDQ